eukprot:3326310-Rhodomonas_salina.1
MVPGGSVEPKCSQEGGVGKDGVAVRVSWHPAPLASADRPGCVRQCHSFLALRHGHVAVAALSLPLG